MENSKGNKGIVFLLIVLIILVCLLLIVLIYNGFYRQVDNFEVDTSTTLNSVNESNEDDASEIIRLLKDYYITQKKDEYTELYQNGNVEYWNINSIKYLGYYENNEDEKYYAAVGNYKCKDNSADCIYLEQLDDVTSGEIPFKSNFIVKNGKIKEIVSLIFDDMIIGNEPDVSRNFILVNKDMAHIKK